MRIQVSELDALHGGDEDRARERAAPRASAITSRTPWLGTAQITSSRPASASPRSEVARTRVGQRDVAERYLGLRRSRLIASASAGSRAQSATSCSRAHEQREAGAEASGSEHRDGQSARAQCINRERSVSRSSGFVDAPGARRYSPRGFSLALRALPPVRAPRTPQRQRSTAEDVEEAAMLAEYAGVLVVLARRDRRVRDARRAPAARPAPRVRGEAGAVRVRRAARSSRRASATR